MGSITDDLLAVRAPAHVSSAPDGSTLAITLSHTPSGADEPTTELVTVDVATAAMTTPAWARSGRTTATFSNGGDRVALVDGEGSDARLVLVELVSGKEHRLEDAPPPLGPVAWSPDDSTLAYVARRWQTLDRTRPFRWTRAILEFDGLADLEDPPQVVAVPVNGGEAKWLTDDGWRWGNPKWAPDGRRVAASAFLDPNGLRNQQYLWILGLDGTHEEARFPTGMGSVPAWLPDGRLAALVLSPDGPGTDSAIFIGRGEEVERIDHPGLFGFLYGDFPAAAADGVDGILLCDGDRLIARTGSGGKQGVVSIDLGAGRDVRVLADGERSVSPLAVAGGSVICTTASPTDTTEICLIDREGTERRVTDLGRGAGAKVSVHRLEIEGSAGTFDAWLMEPAASSGPYPTVVLIHGGPHLAFGETFSIDVHALVDAGFAVLYGNPRGSLGYGAAFAQAAHGDWADGPTSDILAMVDRAVATGVVDASRIGVSGLSYGGYLSSWLAATTDLFRAAVIENPVTDLFSMYATSDIGTWFFPDHHRGTPSENLAGYAAQSPLHRAAGCRTPCLFVVGEHDRRCPPSQAFAMHRVILETGGTSEVLVLPASSHEGSTYGSPAVRRAHDEALIGWMRRYVAE